jgi:hypothetical protein
VSKNKVKPKGNSFGFLNCKVENVDAELAKRHMIFLGIASILGKILVLFITLGIFHSFVDYFDIQVYLQHTVMVFQGQYPFDSGFSYPVLIFVPLFIAFVPAFLSQNGMVFAYVFQFLMVACDVITILCIYLIGLKIWNERTAFYAGLIYAGAFSAAYFVITKYDAFPTCLLMLAILFTVYRQEVKGYIFSTLGFYTKVFPVLALPFFILFKAKETSLKQEIISAAKVVIPISVLLFLPLFLLNPDTLRIYVPVRSDLGYYSNTLTFTLYSWIHDVFHLAVSIDTVSAVMYLIMGAGILALLCLAYLSPEPDTKLLLKLILCATVLVIICAKVRSPQYIVWFTPLLCLLAADDIRKIVLVFVFQGLAYIEFPLMFGTFYTALTYTDPVLSSGWIQTLILFTLEYLMLFVCLWFVVDPRGIYQKIRKTGKIHKE